MGLARSFLDKAGYPYYFIEEVKEEGGNWIVRAKTLINKVDVRINNKGELLGLRTIAQ